MRKHYLRRESITDITYHVLVIVSNRGMNIYTFAYTIYLPLTKYCGCVSHNVKESRNIHEIVIYVLVSVVRFSFVLHDVHRV